MITLDNFTEKDLKQVVNTNSQRKGRSYLSRVREIKREGNKLVATVSGSRQYKVEATVSGGIHATCSCPYDWGGYCKHIAAVLYKYLRDPRSVTQSAPAPPKPPEALAVTPVIHLTPQPPTEQPSWLTTTFADRQQTQQDELAKWLDDHKVKELRGIAKKHGWKIRGNRKADIIEQLVAHMSVAGQLLRVWYALDEEHRHVLRALVILGWQHRYKEEAVLSEVVGAWAQLTQYKQAKTYSRHLIEAGLALPSELQYYHGYQNTDFVPMAHMAYLPPALADVLPAELSPDIKGGMVLTKPLGMTQTALQLLLMLEADPPPLRPLQPRPDLENYHNYLQEWNYVPAEVGALKANNQLHAHNNKIELTVPPPCSPFSDELTRRLAPLVGDTEMLRLVVALWRELGVWQTGSPLLVWGPVKEQLLRLSEAELRTLLLRAYFATTAWSELWSVLAKEGWQLKRFIEGYRDASVADLNKGLHGFRHVVLRVLASVPDGHWVSLAEFLPLFQTFWDGFDAHFWEQDRYYTHNSKPAWYVTKDGQPLKIITRIQLAFLEAVVNVLHQLGWADVIRNGDAILAVRLWGVGDVYWERVAVPALPHETFVSKEKKAKAQAATEDTLVVDPTAISAAAHGFLDGMMRLVDTAPGRFVYQLDVGAVHETFERGVALADLVAAWRKLLGGKMPASFQTQLQTWWDSYGQVRVYENVTVIEFNDDFALTEMKTITSLSQHIVAEISPRLVLIPETSVSILAAELQKAGYTPKETNKV